MSILIALGALIMDAVFGFDKKLDEKMGHPVRWIGSLIAYLENQFNGDDLSPNAQRIAGLFALVCTLMFAGGMAILVQFGVRQIWGGWVIEMVFVACLVAGRHLYLAVVEVEQHLQQSLEAGRAAVAHIVGRQTSTMQDKDVRVAAIETLAENSSDGVIAPLFYAALFGLPGIVIYKTINTADSMIGHQSARYLYFGWAAAKLDDVANFVPARLTAMLFFVSAHAAQRARFAPKNTLKWRWQAIMTQAPHHISPNAGWPEAAMAEIAQVRLGGARTYHDGRRDIKEFGSRYDWPNQYGLARALNHYRYMLWCMGIFLFSALTLWIFFAAFFATL